MSVSGFISPETRFFELPEPLALESGELLHDVQVAYRVWGRQQSSATLVCHALTGSADADQWWGPLFGPGRALDPQRDFIISSNVLGGCYGTTGPTTRRPGSLKSYGGGFPQVSIRDMVHLQARLLDDLGVRRLNLVIGGSMGGMQALEWALLYPERVDAIAPLAVGAAQSAWCIALSEAQRQAITADARYRDGDYPAGDGPDGGLAAARIMAMVSYRSHPGFDGRFGREQTSDGHFEMQAYLRHQGMKLVERFDANTYLTLINAMDTHDLGRGRGPVAEVLATLDKPALVLSITSDVLYPDPEVAAMASTMPGAEHVRIEAEHGHDAFLIETATVNELVVDFLRRHRREGAILRAVNN